MDPISLIVTALAAGGVAALKDTATDAVKSAYTGLKALLKRKLAGDSITQEVIEKHEQAPHVWHEPLRAGLGGVRAGEDKEIIEASRAVLAVVDPEGTRTGKYIIHVSGGQGAVIGDHSTVTQTFGHTL